MKVKKPISSEFQFGFYVGEYIVHKFLPTIDVECQGSTTQVINVSDEDRLEYERLENIWYERHYKKDLDSDAWKAYRKFAHYLEEKYLPETLECNLTPMTIRDMDEFKLGLWNSLWNSDVCCYDIQPNNINIYDYKTKSGHILFTNIDFKLKAE